MLRKLRAPRRALMCEGGSGGRILWRERKAVNIVFTEFMMIHVVDSSIYIAVLEP